MLESGKSVYVAPAIGATGAGAAANGAATAAATGAAARINIIPSNQNKILTGRKGQDVLLDNALIRTGARDLLQIHATLAGNHFGNWTSKNATL